MLRWKNQVAPQILDRPAASAEIDPLIVKQTLAYIDSQKREYLWRAEEIEKKQIEKQVKYFLFLKFIQVAIGGNRSSKTVAAGRKFLFHMTGMYPKGFYTGTIYNPDTGTCEGGEWTPFPEEVKRIGPQRGRIVTTDVDKGEREVIIPFLEHWLHPSFIQEKKKNERGIYDKYWIKHFNSVGIQDGISEFHIITNEVDPDAAEGWHGDVVWYDEPPRRSIFVACNRGLIDNNGVALLAATLLSEPWVDEDLCSGTNPNVDMVTLLTEENVFLSKKGIANFKSILDDEEMAVRIDGVPRARFGKVYGRYLRREVNILAYPAELPKQDEATYFSCMDPHPGIPKAVQYAFITPSDKDLPGYYRNSIYIYDAVWSAIELSELVAICFDKEKYLQRIPKWRWIDPNAASQPVGFDDSVTVMDKLSMYHYYCRPSASDNIEVGHDAVSAFLKWKPAEPLSDKNHPRIFWLYNGANPGVKTSISQHFAYSWKDTPLAEITSDKIGLKESNKHFPDCTRYPVSSGVKFQPKQSGIKEYVSDGMAGY